MESTERSQLLTYLLLCLIINFFFLFEELRLDWSFRLKVNAMAFDVVSPLTCISSMEWADVGPHPPDINSVSIQLVHSISQYNTNCTVIADYY